MTNKEIRQKSMCANHMSAKSNILKQNPKQKSDWNSNNPNCSKKYWHIAQSAKKTQKMLIQKS